MVSLWHLIFALYLFYQVQIECNYKSILVYILLITECYLHIYYNIIAANYDADPTHSGLKDKTLKNQFVVKWEHLTSQSTSSFKLVVE